MTQPKDRAAFSDLLSPPECYRYQASCRDALELNHGLLTLLSLLGKSYFAPGEPGEIGDPPIDRSNMSQRRPAIRYKSGSLARITKRRSHAI